jgi:hypothetical protein
VEYEYAKTAMVLLNVAERRNLTHNSIVCCLVTTQHRTCCVVVAACRIIIPAMNGTVV